MGSRFRGAGGCLEGALPDGCSERKRVRDGCLERGVVGDIRVSGRADWEIGSTELEMPQRIEISLEFSWRLLELKAVIIQHVQCSCDMDRRRSSLLVT